MFFLVSDKTSLMKHEQLSVIKSFPMTNPYKQAMADQLSGEKFFSEVDPSLM